MLLRSARERVISVRLLLPTKAESPREVTEVGMVMDVRLLLRNAAAPMEVIEEGMAADVRPRFS